MAYFDLVVPASVNAGETFTVTLTARDAWGNVAISYTGTVGFSSSDAAAYGLDPSTFTPADAGQVSFQVTMMTLGLQELVISDPALGLQGDAFVNVL